MTEDFHSTFYSAHSFTIVLILLLSLYLSLSAAHQLGDTSDGEAILWSLKNDAYPEHWGSNDLIDDRTSKTNQLIVVRASDWKQRWNEKTNELADQKRNKTTRPCELQCSCDDGGWDPLMKFAHDLNITVHADFEHLFKRRIPEKLHHFFSRNSKFIPSSKQFWSVEANGSMVCIAATWPGGWDSLPAEASFISRCSAVAQLVELPEKGPNLCKSTDWLGFESRRILAVPSGKQHRN